MPLTHAATPHFLWSRAGLVSTLFAPGRTGHLSKKIIENKKKKNKKKKKNRRMAVCLEKKNNDGLDLL